MGGTTHDESIDPDIDLHDPEQRGETRAHPLTIPSIAIGGVLGALARHGAELVWPVAAGRFPWTTFSVNVVGCLLIGVLMVVVHETSAGHPLLRPSVGVGFLGGFTTFSTYAVQSRALIAGGRADIALLYMFGTLAAALISVWVGLTLARLVAHRHWHRPSHGRSASR